MGRRQLGWLLVLLALSVFINYIDRGNLSIAAPLLKDELGISASQLGILLSAFFWTYTALLFISGWLVDRFDVNLVLAAGFLIWSLATAITGIVHGFPMLLMMRLLLGIGESVAWPSCSKILARHIPEQHRGFANGIMIAGMKCGPQWAR
jgi:sugar phosphate permease